MRPGIWDRALPRLVWGPCPGMISGPLPGAFVPPQGSSNLLVRPPGSSIRVRISVRRLLQGGNFCLNNIMAPRIGNSKVR